MPSFVALETSFSNREFAFEEPVRALYLHRFDHLQDLYSKLHQHAALHGLFGETHRITQVKQGNAGPQKGLHHKPTTS
jgi:hypothetical protein